MEPSKRTASKPSEQELMRALEGVYKFHVEDGMAWWGEAKEPEEEEEEDADVLAAKKAYEDAMARAAEKKRKKSSSSIKEQIEDAVKQEDYEEAARLKKLMAEVSEEEPQDDQPKKKRKKTEVQEAEEESDEKEPKKKKKKKKKKEVEEESAEESAKKREVQEAEEESDEEERTKKKKKKKKEEVEEESAEVIAMETPSKPSENAGWSDEAKEEERGMSKSAKKNAKRTAAKKKNAPNIPVADSRCQVSANEEPKEKTKMHTEKKSQGAAWVPGSFPTHRNVLAPMVGGSELAFRMLCRCYGTDLAYTPMMYSAKFVEDAAYRAANFHVHAEDRPLVVHFCGNSPDTMLAAAKIVESDCDAIDINLGCPQRIAHSGRFGSYLLRDEDHDLVFKMVKKLAGSLAVPVFCKIRLLEKIEDTIKFCQELRRCGCRLIAVHGRYPTWLTAADQGQRGSATMRRDGAAHLDQIKAIKAAMPDFPILSNGNVRAPEDVQDNLDYTGADGIMSAEGILDNPAIFYKKPDVVPTSTAAPKDEDFKKKRNLVKKLGEIEKLEAKKTALSTAEAAKVARKAILEEELAALGGGDEVITLQQSSAKLHTNTDRLMLALEYLDCVDAYPSATMVMVIFHTRRMCRELLAQYQLMDDLLQATTVQVVRSILEKCRAYRDKKQQFTWDSEKEDRVKEALDRKKHEEAKRKTFEARMIRKAKREEKPEDFYLLQGLTPPKKGDVEHMRALPEVEKDAVRVEWWRPKFGQHCLSFHTAGGCKRDRACAFLHVEVMPEGAEDPTWLQESNGN